MRSGDQPAFPLADNVGTLTASISDNGDATAAPELDPFGVPVEPAEQQSPIDQQSLAFAGAFGRITLNSGLVKMGARQYDPAVGAFITRDPVTGPAGEPERRVAYSYAFAIPARYRDLDGRSVSDLVCAIPSIGCALRPVADDAHDYYEEVLRDPHTSGLKKRAAQLGKLLSSVATCENYADSVLFAIPGPGKLKALKKVGDAAADAVKVEKAADAGRAAARTVPRNLAEKLTLDEAKAGAGRRIMKARVGDPCYPEDTWAKMEHVHRNPDGTKIIVHYWQNLVTGAREGFNFK